MVFKKNIKNKCRKKALKVNPFFDLEINLNYCYNACKTFTISLKNIKLKPYVFVHVIYTLKQTCNKTTKEFIMEKAPLKR